jgi:hypothetical protein
VRIVVRGLDSVWFCSNSLAHGGHPSRILNRLVLIAALHVAAACTLTVCCSMLYATPTIGIVGACTCTLGVNCSAHASACSCCVSQCMLCWAQSQGCSVLHGGNRSRLGFTQWRGRVCQCTVCRHVAQLVRMFTCSRCGECVYLVSRMHSKLLFHVC